MKSLSFFRLLFSAFCLVGLVRCARPGDTMVETESRTGWAVNVANATSACDIKAKDARFAQLVDAEYYLRRNRDVASALQPLSPRARYEEAVKHFLCNGQFEGRKPNLLFDEAAYLNANLDVKAAVSRGSFRSGFEHLALYGQFEMVTVPSRRVISQFVPLFNTSPQSPNQLTYGPPGLFFDPQYYAANYVLAISQSVSPVAHYIQIGQRTGFLPSAVWNEGQYLARNPDVRAAIAQNQLASGLEHYLANGRNEAGRLMVGDYSVATVSLVTGAPPVSLALSTDDVLTVIRSNTISGNVEVERRRGSGSLGSTFFLYERYQLPIPLSAAIGNDFTLRGSDIAMIHFAGGRVNAAIYSQVSGYRTQTESFTTPFNENQRAELVFRFMGNGDFVGIKHKNTTTQSIEVHQLSRASNYQRFTVQVGTNVKVGELDIQSIGIADRDVILVGRNVSGELMIYRLDSRATYQGYFAYAFSGLTTEMMAVTRQVQTSANGSAFFVNDLASNVFVFGQRFASDRVYSKVR